MICIKGSLNGGAILQRMASLLKIIITLFFTLLLCSCKDVLFALGSLVLIAAGGTSEDPQPSMCTYPIESGSDAKFVAGHISSAIAYGIDQLPDGSYSQEEVSGVRGVMIVTGAISRSGSVNHSIIADLDHYSDIPQTETDIRATTSGVINYSNNNGIIAMSDNGTEIHYLKNTVYSYNCGDREINLHDTLNSLSSSGSSADVWNQTGYITTDNGTFSF